MALKQLLIGRKISERKLKLNQLETRKAELITKRKEMDKREEELEAAVAEVTEQTSQEDRDALDSEIEQAAQASDQLNDEISQNDQEIVNLSQEISSLQGELEEANARAQAAQVSTRAAEPVENREERHMGEHKTRFFGLPSETRDAIFGREDVKEFLRSVREGTKAFTPSKTRALTNGELLVPEVFLPILRQQIEEGSKLMGVVNHKVILGRARQHVMGVYPEGIWTEMTDALEELNWSFYTGIELEGYKVGGYVFVPTSILEDADDVSLATEILNGMAWGIARAVDKAIVYGTGEKCPKGIMHRLTQTAAPSYWGSKRLAWTDLHESNVITIPTTTKAIDLFKSLTKAAGKMRNKYASGQRTWIMNETTHMDLVIQAMSINAAGAIVTGMGNQMPIIGGDIVELEWMPDNVIIGMYGELYLLAERAGTSLMSSDHARFVEDQVGFRGTARYDGEVVIGEGFVAIGINDHTPTADEVKLNFKEAADNGEGE